MKFYFLIFFSISFFFSSFAQWTNQASGTVNPLYSVSFPNIDTGYVIQDNGFVRKTLNGGTNWNLIPGAINASSIYFSSVDTGYAYGLNQILKTTNGGALWINHLIYPTIGGITSLHFPTNKTGFSVGWNNNADSIFIFKTSDAGLNWNLQTKFSGGAALPSIFFTDTMNGYYVDDGCCINKSLDGGITWTPQFSNSGNYGMYAIHFPVKDTGFVVGDFGYIVSTTNGGTTWNQQVNPITSNLLYSVFFTDSKNGWVVGGNGFSSGEIIRTTDGGITWTLSNSNVNTFHSVDFPSANIGYASGENGVIMKYNGLTGTFEGKNNSSTSIYPNPTSGIFTVLKEGEITIYNSIGEIIQTMESLSLHHIVDLSNQPKGIYFVTIVSNEKIYTEKVIVQ